MKHFYIAYCVECDLNAYPFTDHPTDDYKPGCYASYFCVSENDNLLAKLNSWYGIQYANICPTKKRAEEIVNIWNEGYKKNGTYLFDKD